MSYEVENILTLMAVYFAKLRTVGLDYDAII